MKMEKMKDKILYTSIFATVIAIFLASVVLAAPTVTLSSPATANWSKDNTPNFAFTVIDDVVGSWNNCTVFANDTAVGNNDSVINNTLTTITSSTLTDGKNYIWLVQCEDNTTATNSSSRTINIDTIAPSVTLTLNKATVSTYGTLISTCAATDTTATTLTYSNVLTKPDLTTSTSSNAVATFSSSTLNEAGRQTVVCTVTDQASNSASATKYFTVSSDVSGETTTPQQTSNNNSFIIFLIIAGAIVVIVIILLVINNNGSKTA